MCNAEGHCWNAAQALLANENDRQYYRAKLWTIFIKSCNNCCWLNVIFFQARNRASATVFTGRLDTAPTRTRTGSGGSLQRAAIITSRRWSTKTGGRHSVARAVACPCTLITSGSTNLVRTQGARSVRWIFTCEFTQNPQAYHSVVLGNILLYYIAVYVIRHYDSDMCDFVIASLSLRGNYLRFLRSKKIRKRRKFYKVRVQHGKSK